MTAWAPDPLTGPGSARSTEDPLPRPGTSAASCAADAWPSPTWRSARCRAAGLWMVTQRTGTAIRRPLAVLPAHRCPARSELPATEPVTWMGWLAAEYMACSAWLDELGPDEQPARASAAANADSAISAGARFIVTPAIFPHLSMREKY